VRGPRPSSLSRDLILYEFEHVNHFTVVTLAAIAQSCGFKLEEISHVCGRPFGFGSVFRKDSCPEDRLVDLPFEYLDSLACVRGGDRADSARFATY
jgi:hypothetical protein